MRIAILGGGISGLTAAYELEKARLAGAAIDWHLYDATDRLGGIIQTTRSTSNDGDFILEGGPDGWVSEKPWARDLAIEVGLEPDLIDSNDATRKTYILKQGELLAIPDKMRLMVPEDLSALDHSPLFSTEAKRAYAAELTRAAELREAAPDTDESIATFVLRHFGEEVLTTLAAPLLSGVFGGDVHQLSVRAIMPQFVAMEREHGSLILALQNKQRSATPKPIFTSLRNGIASLTEALTAHLPSERLHLRTTVRELSRAPEGWLIHVTHDRGGNCTNRFSFVDKVLLATPTDTTRKLLTHLSAEAAALLPTDASSAILAAFAWPAETAQTFTIPEGFGFLVPTQTPSSLAPTTSEPSEPWAPDPKPSPLDPKPLDPNPSLLACTFVDQKFPHRTPVNARILRAFFGGDSATTLAPQSDAQIATAALTQLRQILGPIPDPTLTTVRRLPRSLPQYQVSHQDRMSQLNSLIDKIHGLHLLGNAYRGVGLPDLIRDARALAKSLTA